MRHDYLRTNTDLLPALEPLIGELIGRGATREALLPVLGVREEDLDEVFDQMHTRFGSIEGYFYDGLGLNTQVLNTMRSELIERQP